MDSADSIDAWKGELRSSYSSLNDLRQTGLISEIQSEELTRAGFHFRTRLTRYYAGLIGPEPDCPIRKQAIPTIEELTPSIPEWAAQVSQKIYGRPVPWPEDPNGDVQNLATPRMTHRYGNRVIIHLSSMCAVNCRFCFRKENLNADHKELYSAPLEDALAYLKAHCSVSEVILTGGDPFSLGDDRLAELLNQLERIPHIRSVRFHSRMPVTLPSRLTPQLSQVLSRVRAFKVSLVSHFNHPKELTPLALRGLDRLSRAGVRLLNQSVLLRGVNDSVDTLAGLFQGLYEAGVSPYYLHHPDLTSNSFHFRIPIERGQRLMRDLRGRVSGPAYPHYSLDIPNGRGKALLLDGKVKLLERFGGGDAIQGALYEVLGPKTRTEAGESRTYPYLDLFPR